MTASARETPVGSDTGARAPIEPEDSPVLSVSGLRTSFRDDDGWHPVVHDISFDIAPRETVAVVGESGSGKSVTALSIMRLVMNGRIEGSIRLGDKELLALPEKEMRAIRGNQIAMIFQEPMTSLNPSMTVGNQIAESLVFHRDMSHAAARAEAVRLLDRLRVPAARSRVDEHPHKFSGGMRQRVMIAMALACKPRLLIADEPTTALDVTIQAQTLSLLRELQKEEGMSVLFITHDMGVVAEVADRTIVMLRGSIVESGATEAIFSTAEHPYTRALLAAVPVLGSMAGQELPMPFPVVDKTTGLPNAPQELPDTVQATKAPVLQVSNLTTRFDIRTGLLGSVTGRIHAVENVSFSISAGETLALVGESGCGKSTTGRSILGLTEPSGGSVVVDGVDVLKVGRSGLRELRKRMQVVFQDPFASLNPSITVGSAIAEPLHVLGITSPREALRRVPDLLEKVGLDPAMANRYPHEFSGGQRQRICIARALAPGPKLIVADEAVSALDVSIKTQVINLMLDLQEKMGLAYLFISHDMAVTERISHRVAVMYLGEIVEIGPRSAIFGNPRHPYTRKLMAAVPIPDPARRKQIRVVSNDEIKSPMRASDYVPPRRTYREVSPGHYVQEWDEEWPGLSERSLAAANV